MYLLNQAKAHGVMFLKGRVIDVTVKSGQIEGVHVNANGEPSQVSTRTFVNAAGPLLKNVGAMIGVDFPVFNELHGKVAFNDSLGIVSRQAPLMVWDDPVTLYWNQEEREVLATNKETQRLLEEFPGGVHLRPEGGSDSRTILALWTYDIRVQEPVWPPAFPQEYPEIIIRGLACMIPDFSVYVRKMSRPAVDGGYYCKTQENRPLIGPLPVKGAYVIGALSGFGIMAAMAAGELLANHVIGGELPDYSSAFLLDRYEDPAYRKLLANWDVTSGQL
jgi:glycine/D-amino acid oxidase-like deaminating enzyme